MGKERDPEALKQLGKAKRMIYTLLEEHVFDIDGYVKYAPEWSDCRVNTVVTEAYPEALIQVHTVTNIRTKGWGLLGPPKVKGQSAQITDLSKMVAMQAEQIQCLTDLVKQKSSSTVTEELPTTYNRLMDKDCV